MPALATDPQKSQPRPPAVRRKVASGIFYIADQPNVSQTRKLTRKSYRYHELGQFKYRYTPEGQYATVTFPNGQSRNYSYDWAGRLLQLANLHPTAGNLATYSYGYDVDWATGLKTKKGQRTSMTADVPAQGFAGALTKYYYDPNYQLTGADYPAAAPFSGEVARWTYDAIGNRTSEAVTIEGQTTTANYTYQKISPNTKNWQRLAGISDSGVPIAAYGFDANGRTSQIDGPYGRTEFGYDADDRLTSVSAAGTAEYEYDYVGRRVSKSPALANSFVYGDLNILANTGGQHSLFGPGADAPLASLDGSALTFFSIDVLGSVTAATTAAGATSSTFTYGVWGDTRASAGAATVSYGFTAREPADGGTLFYRARFYDPKVGRFLSEDPIRFAANQINWYAYALNSPARFRDPSGLKVLRCFRPLRPLWQGWYGVFTWAFSPPVPGNRLCVMHQYIWNTDLDKAHGYGPPGDETNESGVGICYEIPDPVGSCVWNSWKSPRGSDYNVLTNNCHDAIDRLVDRCKKWECNLYPKPPAPAPPPGWRQSPL